MPGYPDKVPLNKYYYEHYSFLTDPEMIFAGEENHYPQIAQLLVCRRRQSSLMNKDFQSYYGRT